MVCQASLVLGCVVLCAVIPAGSCIQGLDVPVLQRRALIKNKQLMCLWLGHLLRDAVLFCSAWRSHGVLHYRSTRQLEIWRPLNIRKAPRLPSNLFISGPVHGKMLGHCLGAVWQTLPVLWQYTPFLWRHTPVSCWRNPVLCQHTPVLCSAVVACLCRR